MMATLYDVDVRTINEHIKKIYSDSELEEDSTIRNFRIVQTEGSRQVTRDTKHYSLQIIIAVGFKVNSERAVQFRKWVNQIAKDYTIKGWVMDDERLKRGTTFGYQDLVVDYRGIPEMQTFGYPVILDVTHSLQQPNQTSGVTGGMPQLIETVAKAGIAVGADGIFIETHENPAVAKSDGANMLKLDLLEGLLTKLVRIREAIK